MPANWSIILTLIFRSGYGRFYDGWETTLTPCIPWKMVLRIVPCSQPSVVVLHDYRTSSFPIMRYKSVYITLSPRKIGICIYAGEILDKIYITGLEFLFHNQPRARTRYMTPRAKVMAETVRILGEDCHGLRCKCPGVRWMINVPQLKGFNIERFRGGVCNESDSRTHQPGSCRAPISLPWRRPWL